MGHHFSLPHIHLPSPSEIAHAVSHTVKAGVETAIKDVAKTMSYIPHDMPVDTFLKLPVMADVMQFKGVDAVAALAGNIEKGASQAFITSLSQCWQKVLVGSHVVMENHISDFVGYMTTVASGRVGDPTVFNFSLLVSNPIVRSRMMKHIAFGHGWGKYAKLYSPFTEFFEEELLKVETLVSDLIPLWANLGKCKAPEAYFKHLLAKNAHAHIHLVKPD